MEEWLDTHEHGRAIWIDDDLAWPATHEYFTHRYSPNRLKLIAPEFSRGLTKAHLREIREFAYPKAGAAKPGTPKPGTSRTDTAKSVRSKEDS